VIGEFAAFRGQLESAPALSGKVFDAVRVDAEGKLIRDTYAVLFGGPPDDLDDGRLALPQMADADATYVYTVRAVSTTAGGVRATLSLLLRQVVGSVLTVEGRRMDRTRLTDVTDVLTDDAVRPPMFYADIEFAVVSRRA
jgi:hypothetical protein